ncbi:BTAD domain-containing putative transcriptional regulator, partial [Phytoactinopolyspora endophytica]|uniref:BTAD domain-containing putative transcriptional regulator n=1 Tax=Phytoactinopolyspora endophytica TaxID=1642495 RepID=UPI0013EDFEB4
MRFGILGPLEVWSADGEPVSVGGPQVRSLLALLLLDAGRVVTRERLIDGLYGEDPPEGAANALQSQVSRLRRGLRSAAGFGDVVEFDRSGYRVAIDPDDVDWHRFERLARDGRHALGVGDHARAAATLDEALQLWRGSALADVTGVPFADAQTVRLEDARVAAVEDHAQARLELGDFRAVVAELEQVAAAYPLRERPRAQLMRALYGAGRQADALAVYEDLRHSLAEGLGTDPSPDVAELHLAILRADDSLTDNAAATATVGLPAQLTSLVGRDDDVRWIQKLFDQARLVTLTGPGGIGKTRLAIEAATRMPGEVCFVDLAALDDAAAVPRAVISALGLRDVGLLTPTSPTTAADPIARLITALADRCMLIILDNCEHVIDDAARLAQRLLGACPDLRVLATSREVLGIIGESLVPLAPLTVPPAGTPAPDVVGYPAVQLFAERAAAVQPGFEVDGVNADAVLRICEALDGLPLAIELAAARLRSLPVEEISSRVGDRFRLLSRGNRAAEPRHETLRAVVEWSWELLSERERTLLRRLSVFVGGGAAAAVSRICELPDDEVDDLLAALADKSLVDHTGGRYRMLETIREFAAERLAEEAEEDRLRRAYAEYFLELSETAEPYLVGADQLDWLARLTAERANLHAALHWAVRCDIGIALRLMAALSWYWYLQGLRAEGAPIAVSLLEALGENPPAQWAEEYVLCVVNAAPSGALGSRLGAYLDEAETFMAGIDRPLRHAATMVGWALVGGPGRSDMAAHHKQVGPGQWPRALSRLGVGYRHLFNGETAQAEGDFRAALDGFRATGDRWGMANTLDPLAMLANWRGDREMSLVMINEALELVEQVGALEDVADLLCRRADAMVHAGDLASARLDYERAAELLRRAGVPEKMTTVYRGLGDIARLSGHLAKARDLYREALAAGESQTFNAESETRPLAMVGLGHIAAEEGDADTAAAQFRGALRGPLAHDNLPIAATVVEGLATVALLGGDGQRAAKLLGAGRALR